jgi:matrixin
MKCFAIATLSFMLFWASPSATYRFMCNGLILNGLQRQDNCGPCDDEHAPRWPNQTITVLVGKGLLGIGEDLWWQLVQQSFKAWTNVPGVNLDIKLIKAEGPREFGANDSVHELFVISDPQEWRKKTGAEPWSVFGATQPRYNCKAAPGEDLKATQTREIFDSDLVINDTYFINWKLNCKDDKCMDPRVMLVHEIGHFLGLDHPCLSCSSSLMSSRADFKLIYPIFDDMQGLRALYGDQSTGVFGSPCQNNSECTQGVCVLDKDDKYCTKNCESDSDCHEGALCQKIQGTKVCVFATGEEIVRQKEGQNCSFAPCMKPLVCAGGTNDNFYCFKSCEGTSSCGPKQACMAIKDNSICVSIKELGETCDAHELCAKNLYRVVENGQCYCREPCQAQNFKACPKNYTCKKLKTAQETCLPDEKKLLTDSPGFHAAIKSNNIEPKSMKTLGESHSGCRIGFEKSNNICSVAFLALFLLFKRRKNRLNSVHKPRACPHIRF